MVKMKKILVIGSFMTDLVIQTEKVPVDGETTIGKTFHRFTGGKGANQAVAAARLGGDVTMVGKVGNDDFGKEHLESLKANRVNCDFVWMDEQAGTGIGSIVIDRDGNNRIIVVPGANLKLTGQEIEALENVIATADIVVLQLEIPMPTVYKAIDLAHKHRKTVVLNPAPAQKIDAQYISKIDFIIPNETEAGLLTGIPVNHVEDAEKASRVFIQQGYQHVIITLGDKGVIYRNHLNFKHYPPYRVKAVDTTAAGDSFIGSFVYGLSRGLTIDHAVRLAVAASALTVTRLGAQPSLPTIEEVQNLLAN
jgi:ribokinase